MGSRAGGLNGTPTGERRERLVWELLVPLAVLLPAYALVPFEPMASLGYLVVVMLPVGIAGGILGEDRRAETVMSRSVMGQTDHEHGETDSKISPGNRLTDFASSVGLLGLASFLLIGVLFV